MLIVAFFVLGFFTDRRRVSFHWTLPGFVALLPLLPAVLAGWARGWRVVNLDSTILAQAPKMAPHIEAMRSVIAQELQVSEEQVNVKATTTETLGFVGRKEGIAAHAVVLLEGQ